MHTLGIQVCTMTHTGRTITGDLVYNTHYFMIEGKVGL